MKYRKYSVKKDQKAIHRMWNEIGWVEGGNAKPLDYLLKSGRALVAELNGEAECLAISHWGDMKYQNETLNLSIVTGVTTSMVARKQGFAQELTATKVAHDAEQGAALSILGMFEQGFYNQLGFGTGCYEYIANFSPCSLNIKAKAGVPIRLTEKDWRKIHTNRLNRLRGHGACNLTPPDITRAEVSWVKTCIGLGYKNRQGRLTHHVWFNGMGKENGPYNVWWLAYETYDQFIELMALLKSVGDQIKLIHMLEPPNIQLQDFIAKPFYHRQITKKSQYENITRATAFWQVRICDLDQCLAKTHLEGKPIRFNLVLRDPIETHLDKKHSWRGIGGDYTVTLGLKSKSKKGHEAKLPTLNASVGAFTRLWLGIGSATSLSVTDDLAAPPTLLAKLDRLVRLPAPKPDWAF
jgi:Acetyltransferase (GNAT) domain